MRGHYLSMTAYGVMGISLGVTFFQIFRYLQASGGDANPLVRASTLEEREEP
jgi:hypothetical protein